MKYSKLYFIKYINLIYNLIKFIKFSLFYLEINIKINIIFSL